MTTMLEKAAQAAWTAKFGASFGALRENQWEDIFRDDWMVVARAVLLAIREPNEAVASVAVNEANEHLPDPHEFYCSGEMYLAGHAALIDAILIEKTS